MLNKKNIHEKLIRHTSSTKFVPLAARLLALLNAVCHFLSIFFKRGKCDSSAHFERGP